MTMPLPRSAAAVHILLIRSSPGTDGGDPAENSETLRLLGVAREVLSDAGVTIDELDLSRVDDGMADACARRAAPDGVMILTPVRGCPTPSVLKPMVDRLVCADGGRDAGRAYGLVVHGDVQGVFEVRRALCEGLDGMGLLDAGEQARLDRFIGCCEPYAAGDDAPDRDSAVQQEARSVARALLHAVQEIRAGRLSARDKLLQRARPHGF